MEQQALLATIRTNPNDRTARLVYADWLDEHDDPLAEYVRAECELMAHDPGTPDWHRAIDRLFAVCDRAGKNLGGWEFADDVERIVRSGKGKALEPPVWEGDLLEFEKRHGITLPGEYRAFLLRVGNGWTDLDRFQLERLNCDYEATLWYLARPFPYGSADATRLLLQLKEGVKPEGISLRVSSADYTNYGCVPITNYGRGSNAYLVVRGELRGQIWVGGELTGFNPVAADDFTRPMGFFEFFGYCFLDHR